MECPKCGGDCWDERKSKFFKPGKPIGRCKDKQCDGVIWPDKKSESSPRSESAASPEPPSESVIEQYAKLFTALGTRMINGAQNWPEGMQPKASDIQAACATVWIARSRGGR